MTESNIRVITKKGKMPGKTALVLVGVHGNEVCNVTALDELLPGLEIDKGKAIFIYANLRAIKEGKRFIDYDLNRIFFDDLPDEILNTIEGRTSREIINYMKKADYLLDLHSTRNGHSKVFVVCAGKNPEISKYFDCELAVVNWEDFLKGTTSEYARNSGATSVTYESGNSNDPESVNRARKAIINFLKGAGLINEKAEVYSEKPVFKIIEIYEDKNGPFRRVKEFGDFEKLKEKTLVGYDGKEKVYRNKDDVLVFVEDRDGVGKDCFFVGREV